MISPAADYRPIDTRPVRWSSGINPLSLQKRGLQHWIPCGKIDITNGILSDRRYRGAMSSISTIAEWHAQIERGLYGLEIGGGLAAGFTPRVSVLPLTITFWARHNPSIINGVEVYLGSETSAAWNACYTQLQAGQFSAVHAENTVFAIATVTLPVSTYDWHFCASVFVSDSDRWSYCDGRSSEHVTTSLPFSGVPKDVLRIGNVGSTLAAGGSLPPVGTTLRDLRVYDYALGETELNELYRNPYDLYAQYDRDDDYQFFTASAPIEGIAPPTITTSVTLHTPVIAVEMPALLEVPVLTSSIALHTPTITQPLFLEPATQTITTALHAPAILADLRLHISALTVAVTAHPPASVNFEEEVIVEDERELEPHNFRVRIVDYVGGDDLRISRTYTELPGGLTISKGYLTIKRLATGDDAQAILQKQITASEGITGQITDANTTGGSIELYFDLTGAETGTLTPLLAYHYDVQVISQAGAIYTCEKGVIVMQQGVTDATN